MQTNTSKCPNYIKVASSNGVVTITRRKPGIRKSVYVTHNEEKYEIPHYFNSFKFREDMRIKAGILKQCFDYLNLRITGKGYKSIHEFKHCYV